MQDFFFHLRKTNLDYILVYEIKDYNYKKYIIVIEQGLIMIVFTIINLNKINL